ncbi:excinuclease ABC subunit C [Candidatus Berkelbacteria bacterium CG10_big_fil_rev_8_21_14_0_10_41_12]|uniref:Excinuclease ABC subunit C n=1 Tax=Candidatus Berkelbacteria bacterium CG10_big_fil_rev_8_21_14_0_10_41_12 TaxID=1974513 RepID=A0A2M6WXF3_9BACT|nr:MAG: excinuclease ABC subunit C [Candidatus Berkelbacteria bacterium CG10_big_fil_rev_8_21_14_0_10_41_12]
MYFVYVLKSGRDKNLYIGSTNNLKRRIDEHNRGSVSSTKYRIPFELVYCEVYKSENDVHRRESNLKLRSKAFQSLKKRIVGSVGA